jgi:cell division protein ZipA
MSELRVALIILGAVFLAVLLLWERRRTMRNVRPMTAQEPAQQSALAPQRARRMEPSIDDFSPGEDPAPDSLDVPTIHPMEPVRVEVMREVAVDVPGAAVARIEPHHVDPPRIEFPAVETPRAASAHAQPPAIRWPPPLTERVLTMRVVRADGQPLAGRALRLALESAGMVHGPQRIFHRVDAEGVVRASAANLMRPGTFDPEHMDAQEFRGLSMFSILPGPVSAAQMLDDLLELATLVAGRVDAMVQDEQGMPLAGERLAQLRRSISPPPGGAPA